MKRKATTLAMVALLCAVFLVNLSPTPASANDYEDGLRQLEDEYGVTRQQCADDWLGLHFTACGAIDAYQRFDTRKFDQYGYDGMDSVEFAKEFAAVGGFSPGAGSLVRGAVAKATPVAQGLSAKAKDAIATGLVALGGLVAINSTGMGRQEYTVDPATTDLNVDAFIQDGWVQQTNRWSRADGGSGGSYPHYDSIEAFLTVMSAPAYGTPGPWQAVVSVEYSGVVDNQNLNNIRNDTWGIPEFRVVRPDGSVTSISGSCPIPTDGAGVVECVVSSSSSSAVFAGLTLATHGHGATTYTVPPPMWFQEGAELWEEGSPGGMVGTLTTVFQCTNAAGTQDLTFSETFSGGFELDVAPKECPDGHVLTGGYADWVTAEQTQRVWEYDAPDEIKAIPTEFDHCLAGSDCGLSLWQTLTGQPAQSCGALAVGCQSWWGDSNKVENYECRAGGQAVDLGYCAIYRKPGEVSPVTAVNVSPDGKVGIGTRVKTVNPEDYEHLVKVPAPAVQPDPGPGPNPNPVPPPGPVVPDEDIEGDTSRCFPSGWGLFNPVEWVLKPLKCAFMPREGFIEYQIGVWQSEIFSKPPFVIITTAATVVGGLLGGYNSGVCEFPDFLPMSDVDLEISCTQPDGWGVIYDVLTVTIWASGLWGAARMVAAGVGNREVPA